MDNLDEYDLFKDEFTNNLGKYEKETELLCPYIDEKLLEHLKFCFGVELGFDKKISIDEYKFRTGIVEVLKYLQDNFEIQNKKRG